MDALNEQFLNRLVLEEQQISLIVRRIYELRRSWNKNHTLAFFCRAANMPSPGYLSDIMSQRRKLHPKYAAPLARALGLKGHAAKYFEITAKLDREKDPKERSQLERRLTSIRKALAVKKIKPDSSLENFDFAIELFCAIGLFQNRATISELKKLYAKPSKVDRAIQVLRGLDWIQLEDDIITPKENVVAFGEPDSPNSYAEFVKASLASAQKVAEHWFPKRSEALFSSAVLSVKAEEYKQMLASFRDEILEVQSGIASDDADMIVRFNVQVYPVLNKKS